MDSQQSGPADSIFKALTNPDAAVSPTSVARLEELYPYFTLPAMLMLKRNAGAVSPGLREKMLDRLALLATDKEVLLRMVDLSETERANFYPPQQAPEKVSTDSAIDTFLSTYGDTSPEEMARLEKQIFNPVPYDYTKELETREAVVPAADAPRSTHEVLIDAFLEKHSSDVPAVAPEPESPTPEQPHEKVEKPVAASSLLSESLAKIFIKQGRYAKAYEIITNLSLNFPEKSAYFADQLRFLQKLIINQSYNNKANQ